MSGEGRLDALNGMAAPFTWLAEHARFSGAIMLSTAAMGGLAFPTNSAAKKGPPTGLGKDSSASILGGLANKFTNPIFDGNISGIELSTEDGISLDILPDNADLYAVNREEKTAFVGVRMPGEKTIKSCGNISLWEVEQKHQKELLPNIPSNPCTIKRMNRLKNRYTVATKIKLGAIDGTYHTPVVKSKHCDPTLYRKYVPHRRTPDNVSEKPGFKRPLVLNDGTRAILNKSVHYRFTYKDKRAARVRIDRDDIPDGSLTKPELENLYLWFSVKRKCLPKKFSLKSPLKTSKTKRGHRHESEERRVEPTGSKPVSSGPQIITTINLPEDSKYTTMVSASSP